MLGALKNAFRVSDLRRKILYTLGLLLVFRVGALVPVPGVNAEALASSLGIDSGNVFAFLDMFSGGALRNFTVFALGVSPYITASIILQLLTVVIPQLEELAKEGMEGRRKIQDYTRYGTVVLGLVQAATITMAARNWQVLAFPGFFGLLVVILTLTAGTTFLMWLGEKISQYGIGNGISLLIFTGIVARVPAATINTVQAIAAGGISILSVLAFLVLAVLIVAGVVMIQQGQRRIPVQYAKRVIGRRMYGGQSTHIPMRVNQAGVIPVIFASSVLLFPSTLARLFPGISILDRWIGYGTVGYLILYALLTLFFTYFYTAVTFNPRDVADNMKKYGGFIPGLRPGRSTAEYLDRVLVRITLVGAVFLAFIAILPFIMAGITGIAAGFGGTALLIVVGVALETMKQIEAHLLMRHYEGFIK